MDYPTMVVPLNAGGTTSVTIELAERYRPKDDWTGKSDPKERRKLQNRLNQRLWRTRHGLDVPKPRKKRVQRKRGTEPNEDLVELSSSETCVSSATVDSSPELLKFTTHASYAEDPQNADLVDTVQAVPTMCNLSPEQSQMLITRFNQRMSASSSAGSPRRDMLLTLVHFNVFRALVSNTFSMGFDAGWLTSDAISPFYQDGVCGAIENYPAHLRPTVLQRTVDHHPWIDLFPFPAMRDNLLAADGEYDEDQLCMDLVEFCHVPCEQTGLIVWGEPCDPRGWEVSEAFLAKWSWVLKGCFELLESTNYWRERRGETGIVWEL